MVVSNTKMPESMPEFAWGMGMALSITVSQKGGVSRGMRCGEDDISPEPALQSLSLKNQTLPFYHQ